MGADYRRDRKADGKRLDTKTQLEKVRGEIEAADYVPNNSGP